jgi:hypothetical protein
MKTQTEQHTPGPWSEWQTRDGESDTFHATEILGSNQIIVCRFDPWRGSAIQEAQANAALIASAPDLLAERDRLNAINTKMLWTLDHCAEIAKCQAMRIEDVRLAMGEIYRIAREAMEAAQAYNRERIAKEATR